MDKYNRYFDVNRKTWNEKVEVHMKSDMYDLDAFIRGKSSLKPYELEALGEIDGKSLLHLQCHFGQDTLSLSRMGAKCTGIDISDVGIKEATALNDQLRLDAEFICCNVLNLGEHLKTKFDIVFTSYGVIGWIPDLELWGKIIADRLKPGGFFYMVEFHPIVWMFDYTKGEPQMVYHYNQQQPIYEEYKGTYADMESEMVSREYGWNHGLGKVITALSRAGLIIEYLNEFDESPYDVLPGLVKKESGMFGFKTPLYPLIFSVKAIKP